MPINRVPLLIILIKVIGMTIQTPRQIRIPTMVVVAALALGTMSCSEAENPNGQTQKGSYNQGRVESQWLYQSAKGESSTLQLFRLNDELQKKKSELYPYSFCAPDGNLWVGGKDPNPISWISGWVICSRVVSFEVELIGIDGEIIERFEFHDCDPALYKMGWDDNLKPGIYTVRIYYQGQKTAEFRLKK